MLIRDAGPGDLEGIFAIYDEQVRTGTCTFDTVVKTPAEREDWFRMSDRTRYPVLVAEEAGSVVGWARLYPWSPRKAYDRTAENAVYVRPDRHGRGIGSALLGELLERARGAGIWVVVARVVEGNPGSERLHESMGFGTIGVMRRVGEKFGRLLDVRLMDVHLDRPR